MNGYFSRLLEQSMSQARPTGGSAPAPPTRPPARIGLEEPVEPREDERTRGTRHGPEAASEVSGQVEEPVRRQAERIVHREVADPPRRRPEDQRQQTRPEGWQADPRSPDPPPPRRVGEIEELPAGTDAAGVEARASRSGDPDRGELELYETVEGTTQRPAGRSPSDAGASEAALVPLSEEAPWDPAGRERVWRSTFEEVRGWVAGSPLADDERAEGRSSALARAPASVDAGPPFDAERAATARPVSDGHPRPREEPETQDLRLEIGTISVTVEEPQREIPRSGLRAGVHEKKPAGEGGRSRLSRHYLRVR